ncbi:SpoIIE family protein phosphatase [Streptomyces sp. NPDC059894]|uniref:SpoIIE family protein phosphatase n=1 Tax=unclassified Streptomyces TaxID=2593676 RepID=UPI00364DE71E
MSESEVAGGLGAGAENQLRGSHTATAVVDGTGRISLWSPRAEALLGYPAGEVCGTPAVDLLAIRKSRDAAVACGGEQQGAARGWDGVLALRHRDGHELRVALYARPLLGREGQAGWSISAADARQVEREEVDRAVLQALFTQSPIPITVMDSELRYRWVNAATARLAAVPAERLIGRRIGEDQPEVDFETIERVLRHVRDTGEPVLDFQVRGRLPSDPDRERVASGSSFRLTDQAGRLLGMCQTYVDITDGWRAQQRLELLTEAGGRIGTTLDVERTAQDLVDILVPAFGDVAWVELAEAVLEGDEPPKALGGGRQHWRRAAVASATGTWPAGLLRHGAPVPLLPDTSTLRGLQHGKAKVIDREQFITQLRDPRLVELFVPHSGRWIALAPLFARGLVLGVVAVWRAERPDPFDQEDAELLTEIASRAALSVDNARRYTREHRAAVALQQRLLPAATTGTAAAQTVGFYRPAGGGAEISGDWFDVIALPSLRVALVVGDVAGHGLHATATMGRLRTAIQTLADLELDPTELLTHLDDMVQRLAAEAPHGDAIGATCLYAVYDPVTRHCAMATAGHPPPVVVRPDRTVQVVDVSPGPPLGVGGMPFETVTIDLDPGSTLALYTDGLLHRDTRDLGAGLRWLTDSLATLSGPERDLSDIGRTLLTGLEEHPRHDDIALLLARTRALPVDTTASWEFPADPAVVADAREAVARRLTAWGLDELAFTTELIVSELVTNAVRYAGGPVGLRLIRENVLVCEVTDPSNTQPRLRRARWSDEGGRGLFLVAQLTTRWGSRYGQNGKTIWAEQPLTAYPGQLASPLQTTP